MSILYYIIIVIGSIIGGFAIGFMIFFMVTYIIDWRQKRKAKSLTKDEMKSHGKPLITERSVKDRDERELQHFRQSRQFERLKHFAEKTEGEGSGEYDVRDVFGEPERDSIQNENTERFDGIEQNNVRNPREIDGFKF